MKPAVRKKQPEQVRNGILRAAAEIAAECGLEFVTTPAVAKRAGVTSGGLFHHFPTKKHLIDELVVCSIKEFETLIDEQLLQDPEVAGRFTRAYLRVCYNYANKNGDGRLLGAFISAINHEGELIETWNGWLSNQLKKYGREKDPALGAIIRYAADGLWMETLAGPGLDLKARQAAMERLLEWTRQL